MKIYLNSLVVILIVLAIASCGGGGSEQIFNTRLAGKWSGPIFQSGCAKCNDAQFVCAGAGLVISTPTISISASPSSDSQSEIISLDFAGCNYVGERLEESQVTTVANSSECYGTFKITEITNSAIHISIPAGALPAAPPVTCVVGANGILNRAK